jgi:type III pantothenate kinase
MIRELSNDPGPLSIVVVDIGNTTTRVARWVEGGVLDLGRAASADAAGVRAVLTTVRGHCENTERQAIVISSVVPAQTSLLADHITNDLDLRPFIIGDNTALPLEVAVRQPETLGVDRVCTAAAAYDRIGRACAVIDVGCAVTVDFVDNAGVFQGGAILPGPELQARALAEWTAQLPSISLHPGVPVVGKDTAEAIASGICVGLAGAIRGIVEAMAMEAGDWPQTLLTGGGAGLLLDRLDFVDNHVPDLCLMGAGLAYVKRALRMQEGS